MTMKPSERVLEVLLVEDNPGDAELLREAFEEGGSGTAVRWLEDGEEAEAYLFRRGKYADAPRPDLILMDVNLPRRSGHEVLKLIKQDEELKSIPVIVFSGSYSVGDMRKAYETYANCYISKPVNLEQFERTARLIEAFWLQTARLLPTR